MIGTGLAEMAPGFLKGLQLMVTDIDVARAELVSRGVEVSEIQELGRPGRPGFRFVFLTDPDGNGWAVQEIRNHRAAVSSRRPLLATLSSKLP